MTVRAEEDIDLLVAKGTQVKDLTFSYDVPEQYLNGAEIAPSLTITDQQGAELYRGPLSYQVTQSAGGAAPSIWKGQTFVYPIKETALLLLKWAGGILGVLVAGLFTTRFFIRRHYKKLREERRRRKLAARKRQQAAQKKQRREQQQGTQAGSLTTRDNVTYWPGVRPDQWSSTGGQGL